MDDFLQKLEKVVRIMLYRPAISQSDCKKAGPYQLPYNKDLYRGGTLSVRSRLCSKDQLHHHYDDVEGYQNCSGGCW